MNVYKRCGHCKINTIQVNNTSSSAGACCIHCGTWNEFNWSRRYPVAIAETTKPQ